MSGIDVGAFERAYGNEEEVGNGIKASSIPHKQIFITRYNS